jgi:hypothetical protein
MRGNRRNEIKKISLGMFVFLVIAAEEESQNGSLYPSYAG